MLPRKALSAALLTLGCFAATCVTAWAGIEVEVSQLSGEKVTGELLSLAPDHAVVKQDGAEVRLNYTDLIAITPVKKSSDAKGPESSVTIDLVDGSELRASSYTVSDSQAVAALRNGGQAETHTRSIRSVRFQSQKGDLIDQWTSIIDVEAKGDLIVVRKTTMVEVEDENGDKKTVTRDALDYLEGIVHDITAESVQFEFNGRKIDVNRSKLDGVVYYHPPGRELPDAMCQVDDLGGGAYRAKTLETDADQIHLVSVAGARLSLPLAAVQRFDFSSGKIAYLSDLDPDRIEWSPFFDPGPIAENLTRWNMPRRDISFDGASLQLAGKSYAKGLAIHSRTLLTYRLNGKFGRFLAKAGIDDSVGEGGNVELLIRGDGQDLYRGQLSGKDEQPVEIDLDITDVRRLTILVDFGEAGDIADHLDLCDARVKK
ncbi:NPCBM/NEW2 domain-containing protein [Lignipirellula cremea]|uniref:NPCBM/NEW2 domain protein n=1 Tax=Lignipirellula cremea TaxID=2528010 RepID=A0A518DMU3_9BACT|nr:NPCBM/NEW2 domain-containing protein [Lignipirellula cremea]QDU93142.1 NPCBM/NEW2 domain protein [Lignipirellula cremea]